MLVYLAAIFCVESMLPVSTTIVSSNNPWTLSRQRARTVSSFFTIKQRLIVAIGKPPCFYNEKKISRRRWRKASVLGDFAYGKQRCWKIQGGQCCNRLVAVPFLSNFALTREQCGDKIIHELRYRSSVEGDFKWIIKHNIIRSW